MDGYALFSTVALLAQVVLAILCVVHVLLNRQLEPASAITWIFIGVFIPFLGPLIYVLFGINRVKLRATKLKNQLLSRYDDSNKQLNQINDNQLPDNLNSNKAIIKAAKKLTGLPLTANNSLELLENGEQAYPLMLAAIDGAKQDVWLETYLFDSGPVGTQFTDALIAAQRRGVQVRFILDGLGAYADGKKSAKALLAAGVQLQYFLPPQLFPPQIRINLRNHRKLLIVDGRLAFTGGMNITSQHLAATATGERTRDLHFQIQGQVIQQLAEVFREDWYFVTGQTLQLPPMQDSDGDAVLRAVTDAPSQGKDVVSHLAAVAISQAKKSVVIFTPYFLPPRELRASLRLAVLKGVKVTVVTPGKADHGWVSWAVRHGLGYLLQMGVDIRFQGSPFMHTKLLLVDDTFALFGSSNLDVRSLELNFELCVELHGSAELQNVAEYAQRHMATAVSWSYTQWQQRPLWQKLRDGFCWLATPYL